MRTLKIKTESLEDTEKIGVLLGENCRPGSVFCLGGDLGAGKTTLTQSIGKGLGLEEGSYISSPSFAVLHEYDGEIPLYHMDFYRLYDSDDVIALGFEEYFYKEGLTIIEWPSRAEDVLPEDILQIEIEIAENGGRTFSFSATAFYDDLLEKIRTHFHKFEIKSDNM